LAIYSMTGYAAVSEELPLGTLSVEIRSVNHRYLDLQFRLPDEFRTFEPALREQIATRLTRGKVECRIGLAKNPAAQLSMQLNAALLQQLVQLEHAVRAQLPGSAPLSASDVLRWPGMLEADVLPLEQLRDHTQALIERAMVDFSASRAREGEKLAALLLERVARMQQLANKMQPKIPQLVSAYQEKLLARLREATAEPEGDRLRQEVVLFASKVDVEEELNRLTTHLTEVRRILDQGGPVGKRLDFLMQELNREANTLGAKSADMDVSQGSVELKVLIEQMREQVQNIE
jgi:uncharacterized protein (TIGR00255 family)